MKNDYCSHFIILFLKLKLFKIDPKMNWFLTSYESTSQPGFPLALYVETLNIIQEPSVFIMTWVLVASSIWGGSIYNGL